MEETKFVVLRVVGNDETVLKIFDDDEKDAAIAYGESVARENTIGTIACIRAWFDAAGQKRDDIMEIFEAWKAGSL